MSRSSTQFLLTALFTFLFINANAQQPQLKVAGNDSASVVLSKMKVEVKVIGNYSITTMEMTFCNNTSRVLEGELTFPMPDGVSISRYAIDINGKMREAVPVEKEKGQVAFENIIRRNVDPGLLEKVEGNNFRTRIYPIPANGCRTVLIGYDQLLTAQGPYSFGYNLPLHFTKPLAHFDFAITVASNYIPEVGTDCNTNLKFEELNKVFTASVSKENFIPDGVFSISIPKTPDAAEVSMQEKNGQYYFLINTFPEVKVTDKKIPDRITVIWDASLSGLKRDHKKEMELLESYIKTKGNLVINLYQVNTQFNKINSFVISNGNCDALKKALENITYDGATDFSSITYIPLADEYLVFTDGLNTFGNIDNMILPQRPVYTICAAPAADYALLKYVAAQTGAAFINLNELDVATAQKYLTQQTLSFLGIKANSNITQLYPSMPAPVVDNCSIAGISNSGHTSITLQFGYGTTVIFEKTIELDLGVNRTNFVDIQKIWAQKKIAEFEIQYERNKEVINNLGKQYGIVTRGTSLIVLDAVEDYVQYEIEPPAELRKEYDMLIKAKQENYLTQQKDALAEAVKYFVDVQDWWKKNYKQVYFRYKAKEDTRVFTEVNNVGASAAVTTQYFSAPLATTDGLSSTTSPPPLPTTAVPFLRIGSDEDKALMEEEKVVVNAGTYAWKNQTPMYDSNGVSSITITDNTPDKTYIQELNKVAKANKYAKYLELRKDNVGDPVFYFSVANEFFKASDTATGYLILSNIADLNLDDHELYKMLGYKLKTVGAYRDEINVFKKVVQWRPQDPQSYRDYALALEDAGLYQNALDTLYFSLTKNYDQQIKDLYPGIEEIIVTEINNLIALHGSQLDISKIDERLLKQLPVDIRVVLNWNMNDTDIDLWVIDPNGEKCFYGHKLTTIGGRISNDFTRGYGPEHFMLKKALKGKYKVLINYFGDRQQKIAGPTTVMAEIFTNYNRPVQQRKMITLQMQKKDNGEVLVGEFNFQ
jgi:Ca-activated chloride channel homolog